MLDNKLRLCAEDNQKLLLELGDMKKENDLFNAKLQDYQRNYNSDKLNDILEQKEQLLNEEKYKNKEIIDELEQTRNELLALKSELALNYNNNKNYIGENEELEISNRTKELKIPIDSDFNSPKRKNHSPLRKAYETPNSINEDEKYTSGKKQGKNEQINEENPKEYEPDLLSAINELSLLILSKVIGKLIVEKR